MEEIEVKFLDIDVSKLKKKLLSLGAVKKFDVVMKRKVFDYPGWPMSKEGAWLRVRDEGDKVTMSYKKRLGMGKGNDLGMEEVEVIVSSFEEACKMLLKIGMVIKFYEENRRIEYEIDGVKVDIDSWPLLKPYVEIEGESWNEVEKMAVKLGFSWEDKKIMSTWQIYNMAGINEGEYEIITFEEQRKRK
jgi:adenylate cyclase class 2